MSFFPEIRWRPKKKVFIAVWDYIRPELVGFIRAGWLFFVWSSSAQISMGGRLNFDGGTLNLNRGTLNLNGGTRPPYNLSTALSPFFHQFARVPPKYYSAKENLPYQPKTSLEDEKKGLYPNWSRILSPSSIEDQKKNLLPNLSGILSPTEFDWKPTKKKKKGLPRNLSWILSPSSVEDL